jgi:hypothetical protein
MDAEWCVPRYSLLRSMRVLRDVNKKLRAERAVVSRLSFDSDIEFQTLRVPLP